jgi:death-on-curing protein
MSGWAWVEPAVVLAVHDMQLAEHGGPPGLRDRGALESALARPRNLAAYGPVDAAGLAAAHAFGLAQNHPFVDGNKRTALVVSELFLALNGWRLVADDAECVLLFLGLAAGDLGEAELADWFRARVEPHQSG